MTLMLRSTLLPVLLGATSACAHQGGLPPADERTAAAEVLEVNRTIFDANARGDPSGIRDLTLDELRVLAPGGRLENKVMVLEGIGTVVGDLSLSEEEVIIVGDTAILTGKLQGNAVMEPLGKLPPMKFIATFVRTGDGWRMLLRALTPCAPVAIERGAC